MLDLVAPKASTTCSLGVHSAHTHDSAHTHLHTRTGRNKGNPVGGLTAATHLMMLSDLFDVRTLVTGRSSHLQSASISGARVSRHRGILSRFCRSARAGVKDGATLRPCDPRGSHRTTHHLRVGPLSTFLFGCAERLLVVAGCRMGQRTPAGGDELQSAYG